MSLLDDLRGLNLDAIINARASITASVQTPEMNAIVGAGAASSALGGFGGGLDSIRNAFPDPQSMIRPLIEALESLAGSFDASRLPLGEYTSAVSEGVEFVVRLVSSISGNASDFGQIFGTPLAEAMSVAGGRTTDMTSLLGLRADSFAELSRVAQQNIREVGPLADLAAEILLPFAKADLRSVQENVALLMASSAQLQVPSGRAAGLVAALDAVANARDAVALDAALHNLRQVRTHVVGVIRDDLLFAVEQVNRLRVRELLQPLVEFSRTVRLGQQGVIGFMDDFRAMVRAVRAQTENPDLEATRQFIRGLAPEMEARARHVIEAPIDEAVVRAKEFVRRTLRQLPVRDLRNQLTRFFHDVAQAIEDANLDGPVETVRGALQSVAGQLDPGALTGQVQAALQEVNETITNALDGVIDALDTIGDAVGDLAGAAEGTLNRMADGLAEFKAAIDGISGAIDNLGIEQVEQQLVESLTALRQAASDLLANVPLPEPLRPQVEQLIELLEGVDFDEVFDPVRRAVEELRIPDDVAAIVEGGLQEAQRVIQNLIPAELIASIQAEVDAALNTVRNFNPASLLPDVSGYLEQAAELIESLDPRQIAEEISGPFQAVLDVIDRAHPNRLLAPVIEAYDSLLGQIPVTDGEAATLGLRRAFDTAGGTAARAVLEPARRAAGGGDTEIADPENRTPNMELPPPLTDVRAGDVIRLLGFIPSRLRTLLAELEDGPAGEVLRQVDSLCAGLARDIRQVQTSLYDAVGHLDEGLEELLVPLGAAQVRAQLSVQANFGNAANFQASLELVALAGPGGIRRELASAIAQMRGAAKRAAEAADGGALERIAVALESCPLGRIGSDLDALLAALDPEPIAAEMDALVEHLIELTPQLIEGLLPDVRAFVERVRAIIAHYSPGSQAQKFLQVLDVVREELNVLDPRRLAAELAEVHAAIRATVAAYDPRVLAEDLAAITRAMASDIRALNPQELLGDLNFLQSAVNRVAEANPIERLASVGESLAEVGARFGEIDLDAVIESVNGLGPRLLDSFENLIEEVRNEIVALLESLRFAMASASASVSVEARASVG
jgi:hypothetical protein